MSGRKNIPFCGENTTKRRKTILEYCSYSMWEGTAAQGGSYSAFVLTISQPQGHREHIWISTSVSTHLRLQEIVSLSV